MWDSIFVLESHKDHFDPFLHAVLILLNGGPAFKLIDRPLHDFSRLDEGEHHHPVQVIG